MNRRGGIYFGMGRLIWFKHAQGHCNMRRCSPSLIFFIMSSVLSKCVNKYSNVCMLYSNLSLNLYTCFKWPGPQRWTSSVRSILKITKFSQGQTLDKRLASFKSLILYCMYFCMYLYVVCKSETINNFKQFHSTLISPAIFRLGKVKVVKNSLGLKMDWR